MFQASIPSGGLRKLVKAVLLLRVCRVCVAWWRGDEAGVDRGEPFGRTADLIQGLAAKMVSSSSASSSRRYSGLFPDNLRLWEMMIGTPSPLLSMM